MSNFSFVHIPVSQMIGEWRVIDVRLDDAKQQRGTQRIDHLHCISKRPRVCCSLCSCSINRSMCDLRCRIGGRLVMITRNSPFSDPLLNVDRFLFALTVQRCLNNLQLVGVSLCTSVKTDRSDFCRTRTSILRCVLAVGSLEMSC